MNTTITLPKILILVALILFIVAAVGFKAPVDLVAAGLAFWAGAALIS